MGHFLGSRQASDAGEPGYVYWLPGPDTPADGLTEVKNEMAPLLRLLQLGPLFPGTLRPFRGAILVEKTRAR